MSAREFTSDRTEASEIEIVLDGETYIFSPPKRSESTLQIMAAASDRENDMKEFVYSKALIQWFMKGLDRKHEKTRKNPGHGDESIEGCQACRVYDRLEDDDDPLTVETIVRAANDLMAVDAGRPTGKRND